MNHRRLSPLALMAVATALAALPDLPAKRRDDQEQFPEDTNAARRERQRAEMERDDADQRRLVESWRAQDDAVAAGFRAERLAKRRATAEKIAARQAAKKARAQAG